MSAKREQLKNRKKSLLNKANKHKIKVQIKKTFLSKSQEDLKKTYQLVDSLARKHVIHKNKANRIKSKLARKLNKKGA
ncbi:30S ribosomal protein S20 [bacterium]|nr:30S ribosomal protein S20 [bacterium]